ncbi:hypothetical protein ASF72_19080 [Arthrobacter sp. Leaf141]|nr:hypothetical protein ASF72_19080 [Arthrobacter sp. Leaf141]
MKRRAVVVDRTGRTVLGREGRRAVADGWDLTLIVGRDQVGRAAGARVVEVDDLTAASVTEALTLVQQKYGPVDRIATISEYLLLPVAQLREEQDIPGHGVEYTARLRDKWAMKQQARAAGLRHVDGLLAQQVAAGKRLPTHGPGYVLKPRAESGARGVQVLASWHEVVAAVDSLVDPERWLIERFAVGEVLHVDGFAAKGRVEMQVSRYLRPCHTTGGIVPLSSLTVDDAELRAEAETFTREILSAWGIADDVFHCELFVENDGLTLCEVAGRPGGAGVPEVFALTRGVDLRHAKLRLDLGQVPDAGRIPPVAEHGGWTVVYPQSPGDRCIDDTQLRGHRTRRTVAPGDLFLDGLAGIGVATYSFAEDSSQRVREFIDRYEREVRVLPQERALA